MSRLGDHERRRRAASPLWGDLWVEEHASITARPATIAPAGRVLPQTIEPERISLDGEWLLAGAAPGRQFSIQRWAGAPTSPPVDWHREQTDRRSWLPAAVPGTVQGALAVAGAMPHPLFDGNTFVELQENGTPGDWPWHLRRSRVEQQEWWYARRFTVPAHWENQRIRLCFDGVDYACTVYVNGETAARHTGMFGGPDVDVSTLVRFGEQNEVVVRIDPPPLDWHGVLKPSPGWGWHYGHLITSGIWRSVRLEVVTDPEPVDLFVTTMTASKDHAALRVQWDVRCASDALARVTAGEVIVWGPDGTEVARVPIDCALESGTTRHRVDVDVPNPERWWPFGYGDQPLYRAEVRIADAAVRASFGIRTLRMDPLPGRGRDDEYDWQFVVNDRALFLKGANWCWTDPLTERTPDFDAHLLESAVRANVQMLRVWGGGPVESDAFFAECDRHGILVMQEFPLAFDWSNEEVRAEFRRILRFWLDRGVDGFRVDVAHGLVKAEGLPDYTPSPDAGSMGGDEASVPYWGQPGVHEIYRDWHALLAEYDGDRALCAEAWLPTADKTALWVRSDEMHQAFNFPYLQTKWDAAGLRTVIDESLRAFPGVGAPSTWVLSNHDVVRHASRLALTAENPHGHGIGPDSPGKPIPEVGLRRARAATTLMLALPGSTYLYQGEELGLPEVIDLPGDARQDPTWFRTNGERYGRDGCRVPIPWTADDPAYGFSPSGASWLPQPAEWAVLARENQVGVEGSTLELYRTLLAERRARSLGAGTLEWIDGFGPEAVAFRNGNVTVIANTGSAAITLPSGIVIAASGPTSAGTLPGDTAAWITDS